MKVTQDTVYKNIPLTVVAHYAPYLPATQFEPEEGGYFEDYESISLNGIDIADILSEESIESILASLEEPEGAWK